MSRWVRLWSAFVGMIMIGNLQYAWTLFAEPMVKAHAAQHWQLSEVQWGFGLFIAAGTWAMPFFASYIDKYGPRLFMAISGRALRRRVGIIGARLQPDLRFTSSSAWPGSASPACTPAGFRPR